MARIFNNRGALKKYSGLLSLAFIIALSVAGISYSLYNDTLMLEITAQTGDFNPVVTAELAYPNMNPNYTVSVNNGNIVITAQNAANNWVCVIKYRITNNGTIPLKYRIKRDQITSAGGIGVWLDGEDDKVIEGKKLFGSHLWFVSLEQDSSWKYLKPTNYDEYELGIHLGPGWNDTYTFNIPLEIIQWNAP